MINKNDILKMARGVFERSQGYRERSMTNPSREWFIGIGFFILVVIIGGIINWHEYTEYSTLEHRTQQSDVRVEKYRYVLAERARALYIARKTEFQALQNQGVPVPPAQEGQDSIVATSSPETGEETQGEVLEAETVSGEGEIEVTEEETGGQEEAGDHGPQLVN